MARPSFAALNGLSHAERLARLRDPAVRSRILDEATTDTLLASVPPIQRSMASRWDRMYVLGDPPDYEPDAARSIAAMAQQAGQSPQAFCYDYLTGGDGTRMLFFPVTNYVHGDLDVVHRMITDPATLRDGFKPSGEQIVAARISGAASSAYPDGPPEGATAAPDALKASSKPINVVVIADADAIYRHPTHPYSRLLIEAVPEPDPDRPVARNRMAMAELPSPTAPPSGCRFRTRCPYARERCAAEEPPLAEGVACHFWKELEPFAAASQTTAVNARLARLQAAFQSGGST